MLVLVASYTWMTKTFSYLYVDETLLIFLNLDENLYKSRTGNSAEQHCPSQHLCQRRGYADITHLIISVAKLIAMA